VEARDYGESEVQMNKSTDENKQAFVALAEQSTFSRSGNLTKLPTKSIE
jgi:hypothetical protein